jgi:arsenate reductase (glutaredoxin)
MELYYNPTCSKSREALRLLKEKGIKPVLRLYLEEAPSLSELSDICTKLNIAPSDLIRHKDLGSFKKTLKGLSDDDILTLLTQSPELMVRPIGIKGSRAIIGIPPTLILELI